MSMSIPPVICVCQSFANPVPHHDPIIHRAATFARRCQTNIEGLVLEVQQLHSERAAAGCADKETKRMQAKARRKRKQVRSLLDEMYVWQDLGPSQAATRLTEEEVKGLFVPGQRPPWSSVESGLQALKVHHGRLFHSACHNLARASEEEAMLRVAKLRLSQWISHASSRLNAAKYVHKEKCAGRVFLINRRLAVIEALQQELAACNIPAA